MFKMKKLLSMVLAVGLIVSISATAFASENIQIDTENLILESKERLFTDPIHVDPLKDFVPDDINYLCEPMVTRSSTIHVPVTSPCDQHWRSTYPDNWMWQANRAITGADTMLGQKFGIQYYSVAQKYWTSNSYDMSSLLSEVSDEWGLTDGASLMIAFTGIVDGNTMGVAYRNTPYTLISDHGNVDNTETVQHETGHNYGLSHCSNNCVMIATGMGYIDRICSSHETQWRNAKNKY